MRLDARTGGRTDEAGRRLRAAFLAATTSRGYRLPDTGGPLFGEKVDEVPLGENFNPLALRPPLRRLRRLAGPELSGVMAGEAVPDDQHRGALVHAGLHHGAAAGY